MERSLCISTGRLNRLEVGSNSKPKGFSVKEKPRFAFVLWWTFILLTNNYDLLYSNKETSVGDFLSGGKKTTHVEIMLSIKGRKLEGKYSELENGDLYP